MPAKTVRLRPEERHALSLEDHIEDFCRYQRVRKSQPELLVRNYYRGPLRSILLPFCRDRGIETLDEIDERTVDELVLALQERRKADGKPLAAASRVAYLKCVRSFLTWARDEDLTLASGERIGIPGLKRKDKDLLTPGEQLKLVAAARSARDALVIRVILETGVREGGIATLRITDVVERDRQPFLRFADKTAQARWAPVSRQLYRDLVAYRDGVQRRPSSSEVLFISDRMDPRTRRYEPLGLSGIYRAIKLAGDAAGLERERVKPHWLRACAITRMCARGMNIVLVSEITGVSVAVIAKHYARPSPTQLWEAAESARD
jgi:integrase